MCIPPNLSGASKAIYAKTAIGQIEVKLLPASLLVSNTSSRNYFTQDNGLFMPLFRFLRQNNLSMTTPIESRIQPGQMFFYLQNDVLRKDLIVADGLRLHEVSERLVASIGARGGYTEKNFNEAKAKLFNWLKNNKAYRANYTQIRGVFWNSPMMPFWLKRFEVHVPVTKVGK